jgi:ssDNA-binding Zn-finger/Zn-ribbon topoisomerase 1
MLTRMYCPKCEKTIKKERLDEIREELRNQFDSDSLDRGVCPVCGTPLIDASKKREGRSAP